MRRSGPLWLALALAACGKSGGGAPDLASAPDMSPPGSVVGTLAGQTFPVAAAIFYSIGGPGVVQLSTNAGACSDQVNEILRRGARDLFLQTHTAWEVRSYAVDLTGSQAIAYWRAIATDCTGSNGNTVSGTITITGVAADRVSGMFDLTFDVNNEHVTGGFGSVACAQNGSNPPVTCP
jgi:hypothetical protein